MLKIQELIDVGYKITYVNSALLFSLQRSVVFLCSLQIKRTMLRQAKQKIILNDQTFIIWSTRVTAKDK